MGMKTGLFFPNNETVQSFAAHMEEKLWYMESGSVTFVTFWEKGFKRERYRV